MTSPSKILLLMLCAAAFVAYFGEHFLQFTEQLEQGSKKEVAKFQNRPVYANVNRMDNGGEIHVPMSRDGHFWMTLYVNGIPVRFVIDTGASHVSLSYDDAVAVGLEPGDLNYNRIFRTANGNSRKAIVKLDRIELDSMIISYLPASVSQPGRMDVSLLGMNFLNKLSGFRVENRELILRP